MEQITQEDDRVYGIFGDHTIHNKVSPQPSQALDILGKLLCDKIRQRYSWLKERFGRSEH